MDAIDLIVEALEKEGTDPIPVLRVIQDSILKGNCEVVVIDLCVFVVIYLKPSEVVLHLFSIESIYKTKKCIEKFSVRLVSSGINIVYGYASNKSLMRLLYLMKVPLEKSHNKIYDWKVNVSTGIKNGTLPLNKGE